MPLVPRTGTRRLKTQRRVDGPDVGRLYNALHCNGLDESEACWHDVRARALIAVAVSARGKRADRLRERDIVKLRMPGRAWAWVATWLRLRRKTLGSRAGVGPAWTWVDSHGTRVQLCLAVDVRQMRRLGEAWRLKDLEDRGRWPRPLQAIPWSEYVRTRRKRVPWVLELHHAVHGLLPPV